MRSFHRIGVVALTAGCVHTNASVLDPSALYQKTCPDAVMVYTSPERVGKPYREVALLHSKGESGMTSEEGMVKSQRKKAAQLGANGLILTGVDEPKPGTKIIGALLGTGAERKGKAVAIYVPDDSLKTASICGTQQTLQNTETPAPRPSPQSQPTKAALRPVESSAAASPSRNVPPGTNWIANSRTKVYYPVECSGAGQIPSADRLYYGTETALQAVGFTRAPDC
jgi:hypothetical protein